MFRKSVSMILKPINRPYALNVLKCKCNNLATSPHSNSEKSVLADPGITKRETIDRFHLQKVLTMQQVGKFDEIQNLISAQDVIQFLQNNKKVIVPLQALLFSRIDEMVKSNKSNAEMLLRNPEFENFCKSVNKSARALRPSDVITILKTLKNLGISTNSILCQTLLQILSKTVNELNIIQLVFIDRLIRNAPSSPIVEALKISLPIVFNSNVQSKLNYGNPRSIADAMRFALNARSPYKILDIISEAALEVREQFTFEQCRDILFAFLFKTVKNMIGPKKELYLFCMDKVKAEMEEKMPYKDMIRLSSCIVNGFIFSNSFYYDEVFLAKVTKYVVANKLNLTDAGALMRNLNRISYIDIDLINYVDLLLSQESDVKLSSDIMTILAHISSCSDAQYLPPKWDTYEHKIVDYFLNLEDINIPLVRFVLELISLNRWHVPLINKVFAEDFLRQYLQRKINKLDYLSILNLYQAVKTMEKPGIEVLPSDDIINKAIQYQNESKEDYLAGPLETLFGGKSCVVNEISTRYGHFINHLLVLNKTGQSIPIREEGVTDGQNLQNIVLPTHGYTFAIILLFPTCYCIDGIKLRGKFKLKLDTLATQGVIPVPISLTLWESLEDCERLPYLQREIFSRIPASDLYESSEQMF